jgi:flagellar motility protein MotE (MotC chaperone)
MRSWLGDIRVIPILLTAAGGLLFLKTLGLLLDGGYLLAHRPAGNEAIQSAPEVASAASPPSASIPQLRNSQPPVAPAPPAVRNGAMAGATPKLNEITGSVASKPAEKKEEPAKKETPEPPPESRAAQGTTISLDPQRQASPSERALLERLQQRRLELETRSRDLDMRESLVKAAEKNTEGASASQEAGGSGASGPASGARKDDPPNARLKSVVIMYETMKPKDAAKIFDRLDPKVLLEVVSLIKPQRMSEILAAMSPDVAERLTVELATRGSTDRTLNPANLPKIEGRPGG